MLWLHKVFLEPTWERDVARTSLFADGARQSAFTYTTEAWIDEDQQREGPPLRLLIDDQASLPAELTWRAADGSESDRDHAR